MSKQNKLRFKYVVGIHTSQKTITKANALQKLLDKDIDKFKDMKILFTYGNSNSNSNYIQNNNLFLNSPETYEELPIKTISFLKFINDTFTYQYVIKMDDDIYLDIDKFYNFITNLPSVDYAGFFHGKRAHKNTPRNYHFNKCSDSSFNEIIYEPYDYDFCNGACCLLSSRAVNFILSNYLDNFEYIRSLNKKKGSEDRMVGQILTSVPTLKNIKVIKNGTWVDTKNNIFSTFNDSVLHPINLEKMPILTPLKKKFIFKQLLNYEK